METKLFRLDAELVIPPDAKEIDRWSVKDHAGLPGEQIVVIYEDTGRKVYYERLIRIPLIEPANPAEASAQSD